MQPRQDQLSSAHQEQAPRSYYKKRFAATARPQHESGTEADDESPGLWGLSRKTVIVSAAMGSIGVLSLFFVLGSSDEIVLDDATAETAETLMERSADAEATAEDLPASADAERDLSAAHEAGQRVAQLQNDYRILTGEISEADGRIDPNLIIPTRSSLLPYFVSSVDQQIVEPWYLLEADREVPVGTGMPMSFDSGMVWQVSSPQSMATDGSIPVVWTATQTRPGTDDDGEAIDPVVLAVATADFDTTRSVFYDVEVAVTTAGKQLQFEAEVEADVDELDELEEEHTEAHDEGQV